MTIDPILNNVPGKNYEAVQRVNAMAAINPTVQQWVEDARGAPEEFWARAADELPWFRKWDNVFERDDPSFRWFVGAQTNLAYNCLDHHVASGRGDSTALIYVCLLYTSDAADE